MNSSVVSRYSRIYFVVTLIIVLAGLNVVVFAQLWPPVETQSTLSVRSSGICPSTCFCNALSRIVYCNGKGFVAFPENIPSDTLMLNLNGNKFEKVILQATNFSGLTSLDHLYMSNCGIETIESGAFKELHHLKWLDLSDNRIRSVAPRTFQGLNLLHLFLNGNRNIRLVADSFAGLQTAGLYLHDCSLPALKVEVLQPLHGSLLNLWLNGNNLTTIDRRLETLFGKLENLRLASNPLHCGCELFWFKTFLDAHWDMFKNSIPPSCVTPATFRGRFFWEYVPNDFQCRAPMFAKNNTLFGMNNNNNSNGNNGASLSCIASGDPAPTLYWIEPSGKTTEYRPPTTESDESQSGGSQSNSSAFYRNEAVLHIEKNNVREVKDHEIRSGIASSTRVDPKANFSPTTHELNEFGVYVCMAVNDIGNISFPINITWSVSSTGSYTGAITPIAFVFHLFFILLNMI